MRSKALTLLAIAACGDNLPAPIDDEPVATGRTITGSHVVHYRELDKRELAQEPVDLWDTVVEAQVPDGDGWDVRPGVGHRDGSFEIDGVPDGHVWLRLARRPFGDTFFWTDSDHVSFDEDVLGPEQPTSANDGDELGLAVDGVAAWQDGDELAWFVPEDIVFDMNLVGFPAPAPDTTEITTTVDWTGRSLAQVAGDEPAFLVQYRTQDVGDGIQARAALRAAHPTIHQVAGATSTIDVTLSDPPTIPYRLAWARDAFEAERTTIHPTRVGASYAHAFNLFASPGIVDGDIWPGVEYPVASLADPSLLEGTTPLDLGTLTIPNPFPQGWLADLYVVTFPVDLPLPDGTPQTLEAVVGARRTDVTRTSPVTPTITPIRAPRIAGRDAFAEPSGVGLAPEISWTAPATGIATSHRLQVIEAVMTPPEPFRPGWYIAAELVVPGDITKIRLPADVLREGSTYAVIVRTFTQEGQDVTTQPFRTRAAASFADAVLGPFTP